MRLEIDCNAWNRGFWDGEEGKPLRSCPYAVGSTERWSWSSGYIEGDAFRNGFKAALPCSPLRPRKDAPAAEAGAGPLRSTAPASAAEESTERGVNIARRSGVKVRRRLTIGRAGDQVRLAHEITAEDDGLQLSIVSFQSLVAAESATQVSK